MHLRPSTRWTRSRRCLLLGAFGGEAEVAARLWIARRKTASESERELEMLDLERRSVRAAEESAGAAKDSARWAKASLLVALAALFVAAWPLFRSRPNWWPF